MLCAPSDCSVSPSDAPFQLSLHHEDARLPYRGGEHVSTASLSPSFHSASDSGRYHDGSARKHGHGNTGGTARKHGPEEVAGREDDPELLRVTYDKSASLPPGLCSPGSIAEMNTDEAPRGVQFICSRLCKDRPESCRVYVVYKYIVIIFP